MDAREKEQYLREYEILKHQGKPFFPYSVAKDATMALITMLVIIAMAVLLGAELGPKVDPTTTSYTPRPEWYFFFLFELLRVIKPPALTFMATVGVPTICLILLVLLPFFDRSPERHPLRRPIATSFGILTMGAMALLTIEGALAGAPGEVKITISPEYNTGKLVFAQSGCQGCHALAEHGNQGPGPDLTKTGQKLPRQAIARTLLNPTPPMPSYRQLQQKHPDQFDALVDFLAALK